MSVFPGFVAAIPASKASLVAVVYKMLSEGEARSHITLDQIKKVQKLKQVA